MINRFAGRQHPGAMACEGGVVGRARFELATNGLKVRCSTG